MIRYHITDRVQTIIRRMTTLLIILLFCTSLWQLMAAGWIQGKAIVAQQLLDHSWQKTLSSSRDGDDDSDNGNDDYKTRNHKPWPWADTWPVAKLTVPRLGVDQIVVAGDSGSSLAFAPGHSYASAEPGDNGLTMISAHRDTHFRFLQDLVIDDSLHLQSRDKTTIFRVTHFQVVDSTNYTLTTQLEENILVLVTCYPFDAITSGGNERFLVFATEHRTEHQAKDKYRT